VYVEVSAFFAVAVIVGAVLSMLIPFTAEEAELPATSNAVPPADWFWPSPSVCDDGQLAIPDGVSLQEGHRHIGLVLPVCVGRAIG
jgi:hypothetical protein